MKNLSKITVIASLFLFAACKEENAKPKVSYEESKSAAEVSVKRDSSQIKIADLPIHMEGTKYLIHAIGDVRISAERSSYGSSKTNSVSYALSNYNRFELTGYFENLKFQHLDSTALRPLTDKTVQIQTATFLNTIADNTKKKILVYSLVDADTNRDGKTDSNDIKSLYISNFNGTGFTKLSAALQELIDWNIVDAQNRLYFRAIEDNNKNGAFDKNDMVHYYYVNLLAKEWKAEEYEPIAPSK